MNYSVNWNTSIEFNSTNEVWIPLPTLFHTTQEPESANDFLQLITLAVAMFLLTVVTIIGNTLIILAFVTTRRLRTVTNYFVTSLAVADWLVGIFVMPPAIAVHVRGTWELGWFLCDIWLSLDILLCTASILSLCAISIDRYLAVTKPLSYSRRRRSKKVALLMIFAVWIAAATITCPPMFGWYEPTHNAPGRCRYNQNPGYVIFSAMGSFFLPMVVMVYVYGRIICVVARRHQQLAENQTDITEMGKRQDSDSGSERASFNASLNEKSSIIGTKPRQKHCLCKKQKSFKERSFDKRAKSLRNSRVCSLKRETKTAQTLSFVVGGFIACWLPFFLLYILTPFISEKLQYLVLMNILTWLGWFNSAINPFIYAFYSQEFRLAFFRLTLQKFKKSSR